MGWKDTIQKEQNPSPVSAKSSWRDTIQKESAPTSQLESGARGLAQGATLGFEDELAGAGGVLGDQAGRMGVDAVESTHPGVQAQLDAISERDTPSARQVYDSGRDEERALNLAAKNANPGTYFAGELAGGIVNPASKAASGLKGSMALGGVMGLGGSDSDLTNGELGDAAIDTAGGVVGGTIGHGLGKGVEYGAQKLAPKLSPVGNYIKDKFGRASDKFLKKTGKVLGSIPEEYSGEYLSRGGELNARPSIDIMDDISQIHTDRQNAISQAERSVVRNKDNVARVEKDLSERMADAKFKASHDLSQANENYQNAARGIQENLKNKSLSGLKEDILSSIGSLKDKVNAGSASAYEILGNSNGNIRTRNAKDILAKSMADLQINGQAVSDSAVSSLKNLSNLAERLEALGKNVTYPQAKGILQQLDKDINYSSVAGEYYPEAQAAKRQVRQALDEVLKKKNPNYAEAMKSVADDASLLSELSDSFGTDSKALSRLNQMGSEKGRAIDVPLLRKLEEKTGKKFSGPIDEYIGTQDVLGSPSRLKSLKESSPEYEVYKAIEAKRNALMDPASKRALEGQITSGAEREALSQSERELSEAEANFDPVRKFGQGSVQAKMKALTGARNYDAKNLFEGLDKSTGKNFTQEVKDRAILDAFTKTDANGSRKTLLGKAVGGAVGGGLGYAEGHDSKSAAIGAALGFSLDKYSGQVIKAMLDGKIGSAKAIDALGSRLGKYAPVLVKAAHKSPEALAVAGAMLSKNPDIRKRLKLE